MPVTVDTKIPTISNLSLTPRSERSAALTFKTNYSCYWYLEGSTDIETRTWSTTPVTSVSSRLVSVPQASKEYILHIKRSDNADLTASAKIRCDTILPTVTWSVVPYSRDQVQLTLRCDYPCKWNLSARSGSLSSWVTTAANTTITRRYPVSNELQSFWIEVQRTSSQYLKYNAATVPIDMRVPTVTATLTPKTSSTSTMELTTDLSCSWTISKTNSTDILDSGSITSSVNKAINVLKNTYNDYNITVSRNTYSFLSTTVKRISNNVLPVISITDVSTVANTLSFKASSSDNCKNWSYVIKNSNTGATIREGKLSSTDTKSVSTTLTDLPMNVSMSITVSAVKVSNGLVNSTTYVDRVTCDGVVRIKTKDGHKPAAVYVCVKSSKDGNKAEWRPAIPYVCIGKDSKGTPIWKYGV